MIIADMNQELIDFIHTSPTPFHAVKTIKTLLLGEGFIGLDEKKAWALSPGQRYFVTRNDSSIIAFNYGDQPLVGSGIRMLGAHTDSPCLRVKPNADILRHGFLQVGVEVYGGALLNPWYDRALSLAGKVSIINQAGELQHILIDFKRAVGTIPSLAIHLDRNANTSRTINPQTDIPVIMQVASAGRESSFKSILLAQINSEYPTLAVNDILDYEMSFYDAQKGEVHGLHQDFLSSARLDNLLSCFVGLQALVCADRKQHGLFVFNDHEEVGSESAVGAAGPMLTNFLQRLLPHQEEFIRMIQHSIMLSVDNAHALHPNYAYKYDEKHGPMLNAGPVIKINAKQRYASNTETQSIFRALCQKNNIPVQSFVVRSDMACGSTIGPITATELGVRTLDIGVPTWGMHSIRETAGTADTRYLFDIVRAYFSD